MTQRDEESDSLGAYLLKARKKAQMTQDELAVKIGVDGRHTIIRWEKGRHVPSPEHRQKLISTLKLEADAYDALAKTAREESRLEPRVAALEQAVALIEQQLSAAGVLPKP